MLILFEREAYFGHHTRLVLFIHFLFSFSFLFVPFISFKSERPTTNDDLFIHKKDDENTCDTDDSIRDGTIMGIFLCTTTRPVLGTPSAFRRIREKIKKNGCRKKWIWDMTLLNTATFVVCSR